MSERMPYGDMVQELHYLRSQYEQFIIDRERERIINLLLGLQDNFADSRYSTTGGYAEIFALKQAIATIKVETE